VVDKLIKKNDSDRPSMNLYLWYGGDICDLCDL
jgi:hypothetical protein